LVERVLVLGGWQRVAFRIVHERMDVHAVIPYAATFRCLALSLALALLAEPAAAQSCSAPAPSGSCPGDTSATRTVPDGTPPSPTWGWARRNRPAADLQWGTAVGGPFAAWSVTPATAKSGSATAGTPTSIFFQTMYSWGLDTPGAYSLPVVFTLLAP